MKIQVLGGVINVDSYMVKPGDKGVTVCVLQGSGNTAISMEAMNPAMTVSRLLHDLIGGVVNGDRGVAVRVPTLLMTVDNVCMP